MSDVEGMSVDSSDPNFRSFVALGFHRALVDSTTGAIKKEINLITHHKGIEPGNPLKLPRGSYMMALHIMGENPTSESKPDGTTVENYEHEKWHFEIDGESSNTSTYMVDIRAVLSSTDKDPLDREPVFAAKPSKDSSIQLGMIDLQRKENLTVMLVGRIHQLFLLEDNFMFKPFKGNPKYYIQVTGDAE